VTFTVTDAQAEQARTWAREHDKTHIIEPGRKQGYTGDIGGAYTWCFTSTGIGIIVTVNCSCGEKLDLTDYSTW
jgi:hypothetical protein